MLKYLTLCFHRKNKKKLTDDYILSGIIFFLKIKGYKRHMFCGYRVITFFFSSVKSPQFELLCNDSNYFKI